MLNEANLATLLIDLLTAAEEMIDMRTAHLRFENGLLAERLVAATDWLTQYPGTRHLRVGYFGASTGAAAALLSAAERPPVVDAVVSRGGPALIWLGQPWRAFKHPRCSSSAEMNTQLSS
jgi:putative phosphoribosyl transferase